MWRSTLLTTVVALLGAVPAGADADAPPLGHGIDAEAQLPYWEWQGDGLSLRLVQRLPDQTRAFFLARGFAAEDVELIANACVFQSIIRNMVPATDAAELRLDLKDWRIKVDGREQSLLLREHWADEWEQRGIKPAARIAFEWALFPSTQRYLPGDYNWGMTLYGLPAGTRFDLAFSWRLGEETHHGELRDMVCAEDISPEPTP